VRGSWYSLILMLLSVLQPLLYFRALLLLACADFINHSRRNGGVRESPKTNYIVRASARENDRTTHKDPTLSLRAGAIQWSTALSCRVHLFKPVYRYGARFSGLLSHSN